MPPSVPPPPAPHALRRPLWHRLNPAALDPTRSTDAPSQRLITQLFSGLLEWGLEIDFVPDVAQSWEVSASGREYVFHLRDDVRWSDGVPVTAGDFEHAWKRMLNPAAGSPNAKGLYDIKGARAFH